MSTPTPGASWTMSGIHTAATVSGGVLVGDDGSASALRALEYAVEEAARRGTTLHVLRAWNIPTAVRPEDVPFGGTPSILELQERSEEHTSELQSRGQRVCRRLLGKKRSHAPKQIATR